MKAVILAGGGGTRLWPLSRGDFPKQFLKLFGGRSLLQATAERIAGVVAPENVYTVASERLTQPIVDQLSETWGRPFQNFIIEPAPRNTAPAIALSLNYLLTRRLAQSDEPILFCPADHLIEPEEDFQAALREAISFCERTDGIAAFGIAPARPETGYGYLEIADRIQGEWYRVSRFLEKPDALAAERYCRSGRFLWNSGVFVFTPRGIGAEFKAHHPALHSLMNARSFEEGASGFERLTPVSIDYCVMEKTAALACRRLALRWSDCGSWDALFEALPKDGTGNAIIGNVVALDVRRSLLLAEGAQLAAINLSDIFAVATGDAVLIGRREDAQRVREILDRLRPADHPPAETPAGEGRAVLDQTPSVRISRITSPAGFTGPAHRFEREDAHLIVVTGRAGVRLGDRPASVGERESLFVPADTSFCITNPGSETLVVIEVRISRASVRLGE